MKIHVEQQPPDRNETPTNMDDKTMNKSDSWDEGAICHSNIDDKKTAKELLVDFLQMTTAHGLSHTVNSRTWLGRGTWTLLSTAAIVVVVVQVTFLLQTFFSYPIDVKMTMVFDPDVEFPAITICNLNPARQSKLGMLSSQMQKILKTSVDTDNQIMQLLQLNNSSSPSNTSETVVRSRGSDIMENEFMVMAMFYAYLADMKEQRRKEIGHQLDTFIIDCTWKGIKCNTSRDFKIHNNFNYGNCFTYNSGIMMKGDEPEAVDIKKANKPSVKHGLTLTMNIEQDEYIPLLASSAGIRVSIHPPQTMPFPEDMGITVSPGCQVDIGVKKLEIGRQPLPYDGTDCFNTSTIATQDLYRINSFSEVYGLGYDVKGCQKTCYQKYTLARCGCGDPEYPYNKLAAFGNKEYHACNPHDRNQSMCLEDAQKQFSNDKLSCNCPQSCLDILYMTSNANSMWPADSYEPLLIQKLKNRGDVLGAKARATSSPAEKHDLIKKNLVKMNIYFQELNFQRIKEVPSYKEANVLSDIGGAMGLWVGMSILTLGEFIILIADLIRYMFCKMKFNQMPVQEVKTEEKKTDIFFTTHF